MTKKIYLETFKKCPGSLYFTLLFSFYILIVGRKSIIPVQSLAMITLQVFYSSVTIILSKIADHPADLKFLHNYNFMPE